MHVLLHLLLSSAPDASGDRVVDHLLWIPLLSIIKLPLLHARFLLLPTAAAASFAPLQITVCATLPLQPTVCMCPVHNKC